VRRPAGRRTAATWSSLGVACSVCVAEIEGRTIRDDRRQARAKDRPERRCAGRPARAILFAIYLSAATQGG
jgi:hypothetical protein